MITGMILVNKPKGFTSRQVVDKVVRCLRMRKVGHAGTLDPFADGLLPILWGRGTRLIPYIQQYSKTYTFDVEFGRVTDTQDHTGATLSVSKTGEITPSRIEDALHRFRGEIEQTPPMYSALRVDGKRLYEHAREGVHIERQARKRHVYEFELTSYTEPMGTFRVTVSSGTYVRTLAHDLGAFLGPGATVVRLTRTAIGPHMLDTSASYESLQGSEDVVQQGLPLEAVLPDWKLLRLEEAEEIRQVVTGSWTDPENRIQGEAVYRVVNVRGDLLALVQGGVKPRFLGVFASLEGVL